VPTPSHPSGTTTDDDRHMGAYVVTGGGQGIATLSMDGGRTILGREPAPGDLGPRLRP